MITKFCVQIPKKLGIIKLCVNLAHPRAGDGTIILSRYIEIQMEPVVFIAL